MDANILQLQKPDPHTNIRLGNCIITNSIKGFPFKYQLKFFLGKSRKCVQIMLILLYPDIIVGSK